MSQNRAFPTTSNISTSAVFGKGKANMVNTWKKSSKMREISAVMNNVWSGQVEVGFNY